MLSVVRSSICWQFMRRLDGVSSECILSGNATLMRMKTVTTAMSVRKSTGTVTKTKESALRDFIPRPLDSSVSGAGF